MERSSKFSVLLLAVACLGTLSCGEGSGKVMAQDMGGDSGAGNDPATGGNGAGVQLAELAAKAQIAEMINDWAFFRDQEKWDELLGLFHEDGTISISWIDGTYAVFVTASKAAAANPNIKLKHHIGVPAIKINGDRATSEVNVTIMVRANTDLGEIDAVAHARFFDLVEQRNGQWKILKRTGVYERDRADPVDKTALPDAFFQNLNMFPTELRFFGATFGRLGLPLSSSVVLDKSPEMDDIYARGDEWLSGTRSTP
jgi:hypothetical protein